MYHLPGTSTVINKVRKNARGKNEAEIRENGGVMIWVRKGLEQKLIHKESQGEARILTVDVQGWRIHGGIRNGYGHKYDAGQDGVPAQSPYPRGRGLE